MSHYHSYEQARAIDRATILRIASFATDIHHEEACGATLLNGLLSFSRQKNLSLKLLAACNSGRYRGRQGQVVGYSAFGIYEGGEVRSTKPGTLLSLARDTIEDSLISRTTSKAILPAQPDRRDVRHAHQGRNLRGCIGSPQPARALHEDVAQNALAAAFRDPRFPAMTAAEWPQCRRRGVAAFHAEARALRRRG